MLNAHGNPRHGEIRCAEPISNYAFNPIAEQALGSNQIIVPQRVNAALGFRAQTGLLGCVLELMDGKFVCVCGWVVENDKNSFRFYMDT